MVRRLLLRLNRLLPNRLLPNRPLPNRLRTRRLLRDGSSDRKAARRVQKIFFFECGACAFVGVDCCRVRGFGPCVGCHAVPDEAPAGRAMPHVRNHTGVCGAAPGRCVRGICAAAACDVLQSVGTSHPACDTDRLRAKDDGGKSGCGVPFGGFLGLRCRCRSCKLDLCSPAWELIGESVV